ncbi:MAG: GTP 3',8-cyclase MoaA [Myxococcales bacterium]|nr:GTP 3',8-cyclase MoaA [Myxococcales bacterium]
MLLDQLARPLRSLRLSVTDRCNLRCAYCMPEPDYVWLPRAELCDFAELAELAALFAGLGVDRIRLTGGEPLLRRDVPALVALLAARLGAERHAAPLAGPGAGRPELALTTNGILLADQARALRAAGLDRLTVSLDTLRPERFAALTRRDAHREVLGGIEAARAAGFGARGDEPLKLDMVVMRGVNDDEVVPMLDFARELGAELRFIEYMDVGGATRWRADAVVSRAELLVAVGRRLGVPEPLAGRGSAPAERFRLPTGQVFGIVASTTSPFCLACDRARLTADGMLFLCLYASQGVDLKTPLRRGAPRAELAALLATVWGARAARGAEERLAESERAPLVPASQLRKNPHLEMHKRGG